MTEAQITIIFIHLMSAIFGPSVWMTKVSIWKCTNCIYMSQNLFLFYGYYHQWVQTITIIPSLCFFPCYIFTILWPGIYAFFLIFWFCDFEQTLYSFVGGYQHFRGTFCFSLHGILKKYVSLQCVYQPIRLHIIITEKTPVLTFTTTKSYFLSDVEWLQNFSIWYLTFPILHSHTCSNVVVCLTLRSLN